MGERRKVARRAQAPLLGHDRMDPESQEVQQAIDEQRPAAAVAEGQGVRAEEQHRADDLARERGPDARGVAHQEVLLEPGDVAGRDRHRREVAEPGRHAVDHGAIRDQRFDDVAGFLHPRAGVAVERRRGPGAGHRLDGGDGQVGPGQDDRLRRRRRRPGPPGYSPCRG